MDNNELKTLIDAFKGYRDLLQPIQSALGDFALTYDAMKQNVEKLNASFGGDIKQNLEHIYKTLSSQAQNASDLSSRIDTFLRSTNQYASGLDKLVGIFGSIEQKIAKVDALEKKAESQMSRLDELLSEKAKNYDVGELSKTLDNYNANVLKVSEFINKDVAKSLLESQQKLESMKNGLEELVKNKRGEDETLQTLLNSYNSSNQILKQITQTQDANEEYIFDILDKWANSRKVKTKKG